MQLQEWTDVSVFKQFCLQRLAVGLSAEVIAQELSQNVGRPVGVEQVLSSCTPDEVVEMRKAMLDEVRASSPVLARDLLSTLQKVRSFLDKAEVAFECSPKEIEDFDAYRRALEFKLKSIDTAFSQLASLNESTKQAPQIIMAFKFDDLKRLEDENVIKIIDVDSAKELVGDDDDKTRV